MGRCADPDISMNRLSVPGLDSSIEQARECLFSQFQWQEQAGNSRQAEGFWCGELEADSSIESDYILFLYLFDREKYRDKIARLASFVVRHQLDDGSWNIYEGGPGEISTTVKAYVALKIAGHREADPVLSRARRAVRDLGGIDKVNSYTKVYLAMLNLRSWDQVPAIPPEMVLLPRFFLHQHLRDLVLVTGDPHSSLRSLRQVGGFLEVQRTCNPGTLRGRRKRQWRQFARFRQRG